MANSVAMAELEILPLSMYTSRPSSSLIASFKSGIEKTTVMIMIKQVKALAAYDQTITRGTVKEAFRTSSAMCVVASMPDGRYFQKS